MDRIRGWHDISLSPEGVQDAKKVAQYLSQSGAQAVVTSHLSRSIQTGRQIANRLRIPLTSTKSFAPWSLGDLQGQPSKETTPLIHEYAQKRPDDPVPGGESWNSFKHRAISGLKRLMATVKKREITVVLVTHYRDVKLFEGWLAAGEKDEEIDWPTYFKDDINPVCVIELKPDGEKWKGQVLSPGLDS